MNNLSPGDATGVERVLTALLRRWPRRRAWLAPEGEAQPYPGLKQVRRAPTGRRSRLRSPWLRQPVALAPPALDPAATSSSDPQDDVEVAHEALIRHWPRLQEWLNQDRSALLMRESVREAAQEWDTHQRDESYLVHRGRRLDEAAALAHHPRLDLNILERAYLDAALAMREREEQERETQRQRELNAERERAELAEQRAAEQARATRRFRAVAALVGVAALIAMFFGLRAREQEMVANIQRATAVAAAEVARIEGARAERQATIATSRQLSAQALSMADDRYDLALLLAVQANHEFDDANARGGLIEILQMNPRLRAHLRGRDEDLAAVAFSPDGRTLVIGDMDGVLAFLDPESLQPRGQLLSAHTGGVCCLAFSADGTTLASGGDDGFVHLWDVSSQNQLPDPGTDRHNKVMSLAFSPDGRLLAVGSQDMPGTAYVWDIVKAQRYEPSIPTERPIAGVAFSPDGELLALGSSDGEVVLWDLAAKRPLGEPLQSPAIRFWATSVVFSPDGQSLAVGSWSEPGVVLWDVANRRQRGNPLVSQAQTVASLAFSHDGTILASAGSDGKVILWQTATGQALGEPLAGVSLGVTSVSFGKDGLSLASLAGGSVMLWDLGAGPRLAHPLLQRNPASSLSSFALSPDGATAAVGDRNGSVRLIDVTAKQSLEDPKPVQDTAVAAIAFSQNGSLLETISLPGGNLVRWDLTAGQSPDDPVHVVTTDEDDEGAMAVFSPDGTRLAVTTCAGEFSPKGGYCTRTQINVFDAASGMPLGVPLVSPTGSLDRVAFSPDNTMLAASNAAIGGPEGANLVIIWHLDADRVTFDQIQPGTGSPPDSLENNTTALAFSPDSTLLAAGTHRGTIVLWDVAGGGPTGSPLPAHRPGGPFSLAFSADGKTLAAGTGDGLIQLWDVESRQEIGPPLAGHSQAVVNLSFSPDGQHLISRGWDQSVLIWDVGLETLEERACELVDRNLSEGEWRQFLGPEASYARTCPKLAPG